MPNSKYYDGTRLLSQKDINGNDPDIYISNTNRSAGKTTFYNRLLVRRFLSGKGQFYCNIRVAVEADIFADNFFGGISQFFPGYTMTQKLHARGKLIALYLNETLCGYAIPLTAAEYVKKCSHLFKDVTFGLFDEFQSETGNYLPKEVNNFISIHQSIARGGGLMSRRVPVVMISNLASTLNPYYRALGIRSQDVVGSRYLKGDGFVMERMTHTAASDALREQAFNRAFSHGDNSYSMSMTGDGELLDCRTFVEQSPGGRNVTIANIAAYGKLHSLTYYPASGIMYVSRSYNADFPMTVTALPEDFAPGITFIDAQKNIYLMCLRYWRNGSVRFDSLESKDAFLTLI